MAESKGSKTPPSPKQIKLAIAPNLQPVYSNLVRIAHSASELVFDFSHLLPGTTTARVGSRILMSPLSAKLFHRALSDNLKKYETTYGEIKIPEKPTLADHLFGSLQSPDSPPEE